MSRSGRNLFSHIPMLTSRGAVVRAGALLKNVWFCKMRQLPEINLLSFCTRFKRNELRSSVAKNGNCDCSTQVRDLERTVSVPRAVSIAIVWIRQRWDQNWSIQLCPNSDFNPVLYWMETHSVYQARVGPKLKHTVVSHLGFEPGTSLNENHSQLSCDNPRDAPVWRGTVHVLLTSQVHECVGNCAFQ